MNAISFSEARRRLSEVADEAEEGPVYITRTNGKTLVLMDAAELSSLNETAYLYSTEANRDSIKRSLEDLRAGRVLRLSVDDF